MRSKWQRENERPPRCHGCWNVASVCRCSWASEPSYWNAAIDRAVNTATESAVDKIVAQIRWMGPMTVSPHPRQGILTDLSDRAELSTVTADELEAEAYRAFYLR